MEDIRKSVREWYAKLVGESGGSCCSPQSGSSQCCSPGQTCAPTGSAKDLSKALGYSDEELASVPDGANLGVGCGNPQAIAALKPGETVLDLGSGGGFDCFLAAKQVGPAGKVIGVDMTPEMIHRARENAAKGGDTNVEFRLGEIEHLPVADRSVDVIMSNCVINLSPDKPAVYREAFRALKPGGRLAISDVVKTAPLPEELISSIEAYVGCIAGAASAEQVESILAEAGFEQIKVTLKPESREFIRQWLPDSGLENYVVSAMIEAVRPADK